jgi:hypothetical protein
MTAHSAATMKHTKRYAVFYIIQCLIWETGITLEVLAMKSSYKNPVITDLTHQRSLERMRSIRYIRSIEERERQGRIERQLLAWRKSIALLEGVLASLPCFCKSISN